jgi:hypothetical protein
MQILLVVPAGFVLGLLYNPDDGADKFLQNVC